MEKIYFLKESIFCLIEDYVDSQKSTITVLLDKDIQKIISSKVGWKNDFELEDFEPIEVINWLEKRYRVRHGQPGNTEKDGIYVFSRKKRFMFWYH